MTIFGKPFSAYVSFSKWFAILIFVVGVARLSLSLAGVPNSETKWLSMTALAWFSLIVLSIRVHTTGFGSYRHLLVAFFVVNVVAQAIAITGIVTGIVTGQNNVFTAPEYFLGRDGRTWIHAGAHLVIGTTLGSVVPWIPGCLFLFITKKLVRRSA